MSRPAFDLVTARRWAVTARVLLAGARDQIDALNVFPVADGDTGTNMFLTFDGALEYARAEYERRPGSGQVNEGLALVARGMLLSARGNSGVILSQLARGLAEAVGPGTKAAGPADLAVAFECAAQTAWDAVATPVEGTILSVAQAAARGARAAVARGAPLFGDQDQPDRSDTAHPSLEVYDVVHEALTEARLGLARTPEQLPALRHAGVVDAGGAGLVLVMEALEAVLDDRTNLTVTPLPSWWQAGARACTVEPDDTTWPGDTTRAGDPSGTGAESENGIEVMYLLTGSDDGRARQLRERLQELGSSVVVAGGPVEFQVHIHLDDPDAAVTAGNAAGDVTRLRMTSLSDGTRLEPDQSPGNLGGDAQSTPDLAVVACALGAGVEELFTAAGATVVRSGPRQRAAAGTLLEAVEATGAPRVVLLPNDDDTVMVGYAAAAEASRMHAGRRVEVVPTRTLVQGLAAMAVFDPASAAEQNVAAMRDTADEVSSGSLTQAERDADTPAGRCRAGQWLGIVERDIICVRDDLETAAETVLEHLVAGGQTEVLTLLTGAGARAEGLKPVLDRLAERHTGMEVIQIDSGHPTYPYLIGME